MSCNLFIAIRPDRTRGGRSNYEGYNPSSMVREYSPSSIASAASNAIFSPSPPKPLPRRASPPSRTFPVSQSGSSGCGNLLSNLGMGSAPSLSDLLTAEILMEEEESLPRCCENRLSPTDRDPFSSVLHLTDHCLYRIVRWARNRPDFANVSVRVFPTYLFRLYNFNMFVLTCRKLPWFGHVCR